MIIIGEKINSTRKSVREAIAARDTTALQKLATDQAAAGADYVDVNTGAFPEEEIDLMTWLVGVVQEVVETPLALDSANPKALAAGLEAHPPVLPDGRGQTDPVRRLSEGLAGRPDRLAS